MLDLNSPVAASAGHAVTLGNFLASLRRKAQLKPLLLETLAEMVTLEAAQQAGVSVTDEELQQEADRFRARHGLTSASATRAWLTASLMTAADFEDAVEQEVKLEKFKDHLAAERASAHFAAHPERYARARLRQIVVANDGLANELLQQMRIEGSEFADLARLHSLDLSSARHGGDLGIRLRCQLPEAIADAVFATSPGRVVGPLLGSMGFHLFHVEEVLPAELDQATAAFVRRELFDEWLREKLTDARVELDSPTPDAGAS